MWRREKVEERSGIAPLKLDAERGTLATARFLAPDILARISSLELRAFRGRIHIRSASPPYTGFFTEFAEYRQYMPVTICAIPTGACWLAQTATSSGSTGGHQCPVPHSHDASASMRYSTDRDQASVCAVSRSSWPSANRQQDAVGLIAFDREIRAGSCSQSHRPMRTIFGRSSSSNPEARRGFRCCTAQPNVLPVVG